MRWTDEQEAILEHPLDRHALVRASPGSGKTTTLVGRVERLVRKGVDPARVRVVMFNRSVAETFRARLDQAGVAGVQVRTFDALGLEVLRAARARGWLSRPLDVRPDATTELARAVYPEVREEVDDADEIARATAFWKAHLVPPARAAFPENPALVQAYRAAEERRLADGLVIAFEDMVYTAVGVLRRHPSPLDPFDHLLVDEFQDVNPGRVELCQRLLARGATLMAVGDEDQAINEWCGASPGYLREFEAHFPSLPTTRYPLSRSFRLGPALAAVANRLIAHNALRSPGVVVGGGAAPGRVERVTDAAGTVRRLLAEGRPPGEVVVLYRGRTQGAATLAALVGAGVPVETEDIGLLRRGRGPELARAYLDLATSDAPVGFEAAWRVVHGPERWVRKDGFAEMVRRGGRRGLLALLSDRALAVDCDQPPGAVRSLTALAGLLRRLRAAPTAGEALRALDEEVDVPGQLRAWIHSPAQQEVAIAAFAAVVELAQELDATPAGFGAALDALDATQGAPPEGRVTAMTVHKAKGLEWPCVVLPALADGFCPATRVGSTPGSTEHPGGLPQGPWMEEERRIFYVALTRAREVVYLDVPAEAPSPFLAEAGLLAPPAPTRRRARGVDELVRANLPAATGRRWTEADDDLLTEGWEAGESVEPLAARLQRSGSAIAARLVRLGLVETREEARARS